jgi:hydrogenase small subunit
VGFAKPIHQLATMKNVAPPLQYARIVEEQGKGATLASAAALAALAGAAAGAAVMLTRNLGLSHAAEEAERAKSEGKPQDKARS